jgi:hypothetical protein
LTQLAYRTKVRSAKYVRTQENRSGRRPVLAEIQSLRQLAVRAVEDASADRAALKGELAEIRQELAELREITRKLAHAAGIVGFSGMP